MATDFLAGCLGGCAGVAVGHPLDTVKVLIQTQDMKNPKYRGTWHCLTHTVQTESVRGLYKGMSSPMAGVAFVNAIIFGVHGNMSKRMKDPDALSSQVLCGASAGFFQSLVASPIELVKTRMQISTEGSENTTPKNTPSSTQNTPRNTPKNYTPYTEIYRNYTQNHKVYNTPQIHKVYNTPQIHKNYYTHTNMDLHSYTQRNIHTYTHNYTPNNTHTYRNFTPNTHRNFYTLNNLHGNNSTQRNYTSINNSTQRNYTSINNSTLNNYSQNSSHIQKSSPSNNPLACIKNILKTEGVKGLFRGQLVTIMRDVPGFASYFLTYEYITRLLSGEEGYISPGVVLLGGGLAGAASWLCTYPIDVVKSRIQADGVTGARKYRGILHCVKTTLATDGSSAFFRGLNSSLIRAFPTNAATFAVVTWTMGVLNRGEDSDSAQNDVHYFWNEVLLRGEAVIEAAAIPAIKLALVQESTRQKFEFLPQIAQNFAQGEFDEEKCSCVEKLGGVFGKLPGFLSCMYGNECMNLHERICHVLASTNPCIWAITKHQHNLSIVL